MRKWDTIVIGGGISGLTASIYAAMAGHSVLLLERSSKLGGRAASEIVKGSVLNAGPHALYKAGEALTVLRELGIPAEGGQLPTDGLVMLDGKLLPMPGSAARLLSSPFLTWGGKIGIAKFMTGLNRLDPAAFTGLSWQEWVTRSFPNDSGAQRFLFALGRLWTYADCPERFDAGAMIRQAQIGMKGVYYLHGGWQSLVDSLRKRAETEGVAFATGRAEAILAEHGSVAGARLAGGEQHAASSIIAAVPPEEVLRLLNGAGELLPATRQERLNRSEATYASCLDIVLKRLPQPRRNFAMHLEQPLYYSNHSRAAKLNDDGHQVIHLLKYHSSAHGMDASRDRKELEDWMSVLQPGWKREAVAERYLPRLTTAYGIQTVGQSPLAEDAPLGGLFLSGDWAGGQSLLADAAVGSAKRAAHGSIRWLRKLHQQQFDTDMGNRLERRTI